MSAPAGSPHPAASSRIPPKLGGAAASGAAAPAGPGPGPHQQNGEEGGRGGARGLVLAGQPARPNRAGREGGRWEGGRLPGRGGGRHEVGVGPGGLGGLGGRGGPARGPAQGIREQGCLCSVTPGPKPRGRVGAIEKGETRHRVKSLLSSPGAGEFPRATPSPRYRAKSRGRRVRGPWKAGVAMELGGLCPSCLRKIALISEARRARCLEGN